MIPSPRLIWLVAVVGFPAAVLAGLSPETRTFAFAAMSIRRVARRDRCTRARPRPRRDSRRASRHGAVFQGSRRRDSPSAFTTRAHAREGFASGFAAPEGIDAAEEDFIVEPAGRRPGGRICLALHSAPARTLCIDACYLEAPSPLGLWAVRRVQPLSLEIRVYPNLRREDLKALRRGVDGSARAAPVGPRPRV